MIENSITSQIIGAAIEAHSALVDRSLISIAYNLL